MPQSHPSSDTPRARRLAALCIALIWLIIGVIDATQNVIMMRAQGMHHNWVALFSTLLLNWVPWAFATPLILRLGRKSGAWPWKRFWPWIANSAACAGVGSVSAAWNALLEIWLNPYAPMPDSAPFSAIWFRNFSGGILAYLLLYGAVLLVVHILESRERLARQQTETAHLSEQLSRAELDALRRQIEPHFLFNSLNAIAGLVREQKGEDAIHMIAELSAFLRRVVDGSEQQQVSLREELDFVQKYLDIQKVRFADRLEFSMDVGEELLLAPVPSLILQPVVENAVKHGISQRVRGGAIRISGARENDNMTLSVYNDGPQLPSGWEQSQTGIGLSNVRTRLQTLYGNRYALTLANQEPGGVLVSISLPFPPHADPREGE